MVLVKSGCRYRRKAHPGGLWSRGSLEWSIWGIFAAITDRQGADYISLTGEAFVDRGPKGHESHSQELCNTLQKA